MKIFFSVGEPSGDLHGANLIDALRETLPAADAPHEFVGYGGPKMATAGCDLHADLTQLAVMWFLRAILNLHKFIGLLRRADRYFEEQRPDVVVLIDYPGFNWWIAKRAKQRGIPVVYYGTPQLWAWAEYRIKRMQRYVDHALCKLPFEEAWYRERGVQATYLGHPYFDELHAQRIDQDFVHSIKRTASGKNDGPLVTILPGSRTQEVQLNLDAFLKTAQRIVEQVPTARFAIAAFKPAHAEFARQAAEKRGVNVQIEVGRTAELISAADCCLACSGSVSLELLYHNKPSVIHYRINGVGYWVQRRYRKVRYITLVNLMSSEHPFTERPAGNYDPNDSRDAHVLLPEYLTCEDRSPTMSEHVIEWLTDGEAYSKRVAELKALGEQLGQGGASERAAEYIADVLEDAQRPRSTTASRAA